MINPDTINATGSKSRSCGDVITITITVINNIITKTEYTVDGCLNSFACAEAVKNLTENKNIVNARKITPELIISRIENFDKAHFHCAELAVESLGIALNDYTSQSKNPWKKIYK